MLLKESIGAYHKYSSKLILRAIMYTLLCNQSVNITTAVIKDWKDMIERFMGLKDIVLFFCLSSCAVDLTFRFERCNSLLEVIEDDFVGEGEWSDKEICSQYREQLINLDQRIWNVVKVTIFNMNIWPVLAIILLSFGGVEMQHPPMPCVYYLPEGWASTSLYAIVFILQSCCLWIFSVVGHIILSSVTVAAQKSVLDFQLFSSLVEKFDQSKDCNEKHSLKNYISNVNSLKHASNSELYLAHDKKSIISDDEFTLREQTRKLVRYHQKLYKTIKILNDNAGFGASVSNTNICLINCIYLYIFVKTEMFVIRIFTFCYVVFSFFLVFFYCHCGQNIINMNEDVRKRLSQVSWINRPKWFQRAIILMITRANADVHLKPYGLYVLNHATFTNILNASYTSSNVLKALS